MFTRIGIWHGTSEELERWTISAREGASQVCCANPA
jgi:hypothetical protein